MKTYTGRVTSINMDKTIVVQVTRMWIHPIYKKRVKRTKKFLVHDEKNQAKLDQTVTFTESTPISKRKRHKLVTGK